MFPLTACSSQSTRARRRCASTALLLTFLLNHPLAFTTVRAGQAPPASWLDQQPLSGWNTPKAPLPKAPTGAGAERDELLKRCTLTVNTGTSAESALASAGWIPFPLFDRTLVRADVEVMGGMADADGMCRPGPFNVFVFAGGRFAGTLSPAPMTSRLDGSIGPVRLIGDDLISAEFARYTAQDAMCCPSSRVTVRFRIDRTGGSPIVTPLDVRRTR